MFAGERFHRYLLGHKFSILTDHKQLIYLFSERKPQPQMSSRRHLHWSLLGAYEYQIIHRSGAENQNADSLSQIPLKPSVEETGDALESNILLLENCAPIHVADMQQWTQNDAVLSRVKSCILQGWPKQVDQKLKSYWDWQNELSVEEGCVLWGLRVIIHPWGRTGVRRTSDYP